MKDRALGIGVVVAVMAIVVWLWTAPAAADAAYADGGQAISADAGLTITGVVPQSETASHGEYALSITFPGEAACRITEGDEGQRLEMEGYSYLKSPGKPMLPSKNLLIALPPGARVQSVNVKGIGSVQLPGTYRIMPTPPVIPMVDSRDNPQISDRMRAEWESSREASYNSDQAYPVSRGEVTGSGSLRKYSYAAVSVYPFRYHPESGRLFRYASAEINIRYTLPSPGSPESQRVEDLKWDTIADKRASKLFANYEQIKELYQPEGTMSYEPQETYDYLVITTEALSGAITASNFVTWKESLGYRMQTILTTDPLIAGQSGQDLSEQIRNFLRANYGVRGIEYVLLVGSHYTIPMRYCYPDPTNHWNNAGVPNAESGEVPTDAYFADLSDPDAISWDLDGDGYYGEYGQDSPDLLNEVYLGRIPTDDPARVMYTLNKLVTFEQDTGEWKNHALHAGAIWYFTNEDRNGNPIYDGATCMNEMEVDLMDGWTIQHFSEQNGLEPSPYQWPQLTQAAFAAAWRNGQYSIVNWGAHGWSDSAARKIWQWDDGDGVPETYNPNETGWDNFIGTYAALDDDHPSFVFAISCVISYPEDNAWGNLGIDFLTKPGWGASIGVVAATRITYGTLNWPTNQGGGESMCYEFNRYIIDGPDGPAKAGEAVYDSKYYCYQNYGWAHFAEYWNQYNFNLFGEPTLLREGISQLVVDDQDAEFVILEGSWNSRNHPNAFDGNTHFTTADREVRSAGWRVDTNIEPGVYDVYVWKFEHAWMHLVATDAPYRVHHRTAVSDWIHVDQSAPGSEWVHLGSFEFDSSHLQGIMMTNQADGHVIADAVKLVYSGPLP